MIFSIFNKTIQNKNVYTNINPRLENINNNNYNKIAPISGMRKGLYCAKDCNNGLTTEIYKDTYSICNNCNTKRTQKPLIKSGMQPSKNSDGTLKEYSYSYREYMNNKKNITYNRKLVNTLKNSNKNLYSTNGGNCKNNKCQNETTWKPNNKNFSTQGSVDSSLRLLRLKHKTILSESKCNNNKCNGVYFAGKPRYTGFIYKKKDTNGNLNGENGCPQNSALRRAIGSKKNNDC